MAYSIDLRKRVVAGVLEQGLRIGEAAKLFQVGPATVERYPRQFRASGELTPRSSPGRPRLLNAAQEAWLKQQLEQDNDLTLKVRCAQLQEASGVLLSEATMCRTLKRLGTSRKKTLSASEQDAQARLRWLAEVLGLGANRLVFIDESGFQLNLTPAYTYAPRGERAYGSVPKNRGENTSLLAAISLDEGVYASMTLTGAVDGTAFEVYVKQVLCPQLRAGQVVILDRLNVHKNQRVREAIEAKGCILLFLPNYSPDLNPIELAFSKLKNRVRQVEARTRGALDDAIAAALRTITLRGVIGWFGHAGYNHHSF